MDICPDCGSDFTRRIPRAWWMRLLSTHSRHILCSRCGQRSLLLRQAAANGERALLRHVPPARRPS
ncbi:MAG: hypothetical protein QFF03_20195 [Pseudomonadota bacterium]|nr:hypothetical protein [Pseudomonadota bacterium]